MGSLALTPSCLYVLRPGLLKLKNFYPVFFAITAFCNESHNAKVGQNLGVLEIYLYLPVMVFTLFG